MRAVRSSDVKARLAELLDEVEQGQTIVITRRGRPVARLVPEHDERRYAILKTMEQIEEFRRTMPPITLEEILSPRHEGHKY